MLEGIFFYLELSIILQLISAEL